MCHFHAKGKGTPTLARSREPSRDPAAAEEDEEMPPPAPAHQPAAVPATTPRGRSSLPKPLQTQPESMVGWLRAPGATPPEGELDYYAVKVEVLGPAPQKRQVQFQDEEPDQIMVKLVEYPGVFLVPGMLTRQPLDAAVFAELVATRPPLILHGLWTFRGWELNPGGGPIPAEAERRARSGEHSPDSTSHGYGQLISVHRKAHTLRGSAAPAAGQGSLLARTSPGLRIRPSRR